MNISDYNAYFESLASKHKLIAHSPTNKAFFFIDNDEDLSAFDEALRNMSSSCVMGIIINTGELNDAQSSNHTDTLNIQLYLLKIKTNNNTVIELYDWAKIRLTEIVGRTKIDFKTKKPNFDIDSIPYQKVGPMNEQWYGMTAVLSFTCPFGFSVTSAIWADINN